MSLAGSSACFASGRDRPFCQLAGLHGGGYEWIDAENRIAISYIHDVDSGHAAGRREAAGYEVARRVKSWSLQAKRDASRTCKLLLRPIRRSVPDAEVAIVLGPDAKVGADRVALTLDLPGETTEHSILVRNMRTEVTKTSRLPSGIFWKGPLQRQLRDNSGFYLTWYDEKGGFYKSAFFDPSGFLGMLNRMAQDCRVFLDELLGSPSPGKKQEDRLSLTSAQKRHLQFVLHARYESAGADPPRISWPPSSKVRDRILRYTRDKDLYLSRFLTRRAFDLLMKESYSSGPPDMSTQDGYEKHVDWASYYRGEISLSRVCAIATTPKRIVGPPPWKRPVMKIEAYNSGSEGRVNIWLAHPNPFSTSDKIMAEVDGRHWYELEWNQGKIGPPSWDTSVMNAIKKGRQVTILGRDAISGMPLEIVFSARGYTAAFKQLARDCGRPDTLAWVQ